MGRGIQPAFRPDLRRFQDAAANDQGFRAMVCEGSGGESDGVREEFRFEISDCRFEERSASEKSEVYNLKSEIANLESASAFLFSLHHQLAVLHFDAANIVGKFHAVPLFAEFLLQRRIDERHG